MVRISSTLSLLAVLSAAVSSLSMRIDARAPVQSLDRRQSAIPVITQAQFSAALSTTCPGVNTAVGTSAVQADLSNIGAITVNMETFMSATAQQLAVFASEGAAGSQQLAAEWGSIVQQWQGVLEDASGTASSAASSLQEFTDSITGALIALVGTGASPAAITLLQEFEGVVEGITSQAQAMVNDFQAVGQNITSISSGLSTAGSSLPSALDNQLNTFLSIWSAVFADSQASVQLLTNFVTGSSVLEPLFFWPIVEEVTCFYEELASALQKYATAT